MSPGRGLSVWKPAPVSPARWLPNGVGQWLAHAWQVRGQRARLRPPVSNLPARVPRIALPGTASPRLPYRLSCGDVVRRIARDSGVWGRTRFTRQRPQVRSLSRPPAKTLPRPDPQGRLPEDLPEDHRLEVVDPGQRGSIRAVGGPANSWVVVPPSRAGGEPARSGFGSRGSLRPGYDRGCCLADPPSHPVVIEGHPWRQRHREGTCEFDLSTLGTQPGRQTLLPTVCTSGGDHQEHRLPVKEQWPTSRKSSKSTVRTLPPCLPGPRPPHHPTAPTRCTRWLTVTGLPGLSGWQVPTRRHRVIRGNYLPSSLGDPPPGGRWQDRPCRARPADRSLAAEDRSAGGVRDRMGAEPAGTRWVHAEPAGRGLQRAPAVGRGTEKQQVRRPAQLPPGTISGVGPEFESPYPCRHDPRRFSAARFR